MENDIVLWRHWLLEDFRIRTAASIPQRLEQHPEWEAFDLMAAIEADEVQHLRPEHKAFVLDQYIQARWSAPLTAPRALRRRTRAPVYRR